MTGGDDSAARDSPAGRQLGGPAVGPESTTRIGPVGASGWASYVAGLVEVVTGQLTWVQGAQYRDSNATSDGSIVTTVGPLLLAMMSSSVPLVPDSLAQ